MRNEKILMTRLTLKHPRTGKTFQNQRAAELLKETLFSKPPKVDLLDIWGTTYNTQIELLLIMEREMCRTILETPMKAQGLDGMIYKILHPVSLQITLHLTRILKHITTMSNSK